MRHRIRDVAFQGIHRSAAVALATALFQANQDFSTMATGFLATEDPDEHEEYIEEFANHAKAVAQITPPEKILERVFDN